MVEYYHETECREEKWVCYVQGQGHREHLYNYKQQSETYLVR